MNYQIHIHTDNSRADNNDHVLHVMRWKKTDSNPKPHATVCISVPQIKVDIHPACLQQGLQDAVNEMQKSMILTELEARLDRKEKIIDSFVTNHDETALANWSAQEAISKRLSKESLNIWFDTMMDQAIQKHFASKGGYEYDDCNPEQKQKLITISAQYKQMVSSLASPRANYAPTILKTLETAITKADDDGIIKPALLKKLTDLQKPISEAILEAF